MQSSEKSGSHTITASKISEQYTEWMAGHSETNPYLCWHCYLCSAVCPFTEAMDYLPNQIIRMVQLGCMDEALESATIWICVGCNTCAVQCPNAIDIVAVMDQLRQMALQTGIAVKEPDIVNFHKEVLESIKRNGRTHKLEIMLRFKLKQRKFFDDVNIGLKMLVKRKLNIVPHKISRLKDIQKLYGSG